ncbi:MAG: hypothetical protein PHW95_03375 [Patescibacteria group bacterium]|nr:hypothetical protein [Patescibacteria group bacterium]
MIRNLSLFFALVVEILLLILIAVVMLVGVLGIFLPILPGIFLLGVGVALYSLMVKDTKRKITPKIHVKMLKLKDFILSLKITLKFMGIIKLIKKRHEEKAKEEILKNGLILFGFNIILVLLFLFVFISLSIIETWFKANDLFLVFVPIIVLFFFAGLATVIWYRFGQILSDRFKDRKMVNSSLVVLVSVLPMLAFLILFTGILGVAGGFGNELVAVAFLGLMLMTVFAAAFELLTVSLGVATKK